MSTKQEQESNHQATRIVTNITYVIWNYILHLSYWQFQDSWLHYYLQHGHWIKLYGIHILHLVAVILYIYTSFTSPGYIEIKQVSTEIDSPKYCPICKIIRPRRSKHCYECGRCIIKYDHHCTYIANCIGVNNHRLFILTLTIHLFFLSWSCPLSIDALLFAYSNLNKMGYISLWYRFTRTRRFEKKI